MGQFTNPLLTDSGLRRRYLSVAGNIDVMGKWDGPRPVGHARKRRRRGLDQHIRPAHGALRHGL